ncbi:MAG: FecR domain-containing protein [Bryobacteraceae bacterium]
MTPEQNDPRLDAVADGIRDEQIDPATVDAASARVWARLSETEIIQGCEGFRAKFEGYRARTLPEGQRLLVEDHLHECVACRNTYEGSKKVTMMPPPRRAPVWRWSAAAAVLVAAGLAAWNLGPWSSSEQGSVVVAQEVRGTLYRVAGETLVAVKPGETLPPGAEIRTAKESGATIRLGDGSLVEMPERSAFRVTENRRDLTLHLAGGRVLVEAAKDRSRHLYVATRDCRVAVTGTVFSVNTGIKGSRVAVVEGEVRVAQARAEQILHAGDQYVSNPALTPVSVEDEIAWSGKVDQHLALLHEFTKLRKDLQAVRMPSPRYSGKLLPLVPAGVLQYYSVPNLGEALVQANRILEQRAGQSPALGEWWQNHGKHVSEVVSQIQGVSGYLGEEIVMTLQLDERGKMAPLFLAQTRRSGIRQVLENVKLGTSLAFADDLDKASGSQAKLIAVEANGIIAISTSAGILRQALSPHASGASSAFMAAIENSYRDGTGILLGMDVQSMLSNRGMKLGADLSRVRHVLVTESARSGSPQTHAEIIFEGPRTGVASWLAKPGPIPALDYVSSDAIFASAAAIKSPAVIVDEMLALQGSANSKFAEHLAEAERELGLKIRDDLAAPLGTQFVVALDGPALPAPSWKLVVEVYDPAHFQWALERMVEAANRAAARENHPTATLSQQIASGRTYHVLTTPGSPVPEVHYVFMDGFMIAAPSRALLDRAIQVKAIGSGLARSEKFRQLLPSDGYSGFSGMLYSQLGAALAPLVGAIQPGDALTPQQRDLLNRLASDSKPILTLAYAEDDRITVATAESLTNIGLNHLLGVEGMLLRSLPKNPGTSRRHLAYR